MKVMTEAHKAELNKLIKMYKILNWTIILIGCCAFLLLILMFLDTFNVVDIPFYENKSRLDRPKSVLNLWLGIPTFIICRKMKKIDNRIKEIESMYDKRPFENNKR